MNDIALSGLAKQLVLAELLTDKSAQQAYQQAQRNRISLVSYLVQNKLVKSRQVAEIASEHFGMAFMDLNCLDKDTQPKGLVSEKLVRQHHALPLWRRGNKLFVGISDPTNHQAINDIQFSTGLNTEAILVEDDKLSDAIEKFFDTNILVSKNFSMASLSLSSSTRMASVLRPVLNWISVIAWWLVGSETPTNNLLPRRHNGRAWCWRTSFSLTSPLGCPSLSSVFRSRKGTPNWSDAISANTRLLTKRFCTR